MIGDEHAGGRDLHVGEPEPAYWAVIPPGVRYDKNLSAQAKLLYVELTALTKVRGYAWASNRYLAERFDVHTDSITRWLKELNEAGHIAIEIDRKGGNRRKIILAETLPANLRLATRKNTDTYPQKYGGLLNKYKRTNKSEKKRWQLPADLSRLEADWQDWLKYKRERRQPMTQSTFDRQVAKLRRLGVERGAAAIQASIENSWTGLFEQKAKRQGRALLPEEARKQSRADQRYERDMMELEEWRKAGKPAIWKGKKV
jgi:DNA-binding MarR family transcriptional regulator